MKIEIEIPDEELREAVKCALVRDAVAAAGGVTR